MSESEVKFLGENPDGQRKYEITAVSCTSIADALRSVGDLDKLGLQLETTDPIKVKLWGKRPETNEKYLFLEQGPQDLVGRKIWSPPETVEDELAQRFARVLLSSIKGDPYKVVDSLVSSRTITHPIAVWSLAYWAALAVSEPPPSNRSKSAVALGFMATKGQVTRWFKLTKDRERYPTIYEAALDESLRETS